MMITVKQISPPQLADKIKQNDRFCLLDIRESNEVELCMIDNAMHIPMHLIPLYLDKIPDDKDIVIYCHHGVRSLQVANYLIDNGFDADNIYNLHGGIDAWALMVDNQMARY